MDLPLGLCQKLIGVLGLVKNVRKTHMDGSALFDRLSIFLQGGGILRYLSGQFCVSRFRLYNLRLCCLQLCRIFRNPLFTLPHNRLKFYEFVVFLFRVPNQCLTRLIQLCLRPCQVLNRRSLKLRKALLLYIERTQIRLGLFSLLLFGLGQGHTFNGLCSHI